MNAETQEEQTLYEILGVPTTASTEEIKKAHRKAMRAYHPDIYEGEREEAEYMSALINRAYMTLSDAEKREKYDASLRGEPEEPDESEDDPHTPPYEDTWGTTSEWDEDVVDEEVVEDETPPEPEPAPEPSPTPRSDDAEPAPSWESTAAALAGKSVRVTTPLSGLMVPLLVAAGGVLVGFCFAGLQSYASGDDGVPLGAGGVILGVLLGAGLAFFLCRKVEMPAPASRPLLVVILGVGAAVVVSPILLGMTVSAGALVSLVSSFVGAYVLMRGLMAWRALEKIVKADSLKKNNTFGNLPGGVGPDLLNRTLSALYTVPSVRMMRNPDDNGLFSHAIANGNRVAFVKAITGFSGLYRWSGPSLLRERSDMVNNGQAIPEEVLRATYREFASSTATTLPDDAETSAWVFVYTHDGDHIIYPASDDEGNPKVSAPDVGVDQVGRFLFEDSPAEPSVDQETFVKAFTALLG